MQGKVGFRFKKTLWKTQIFNFDGFRFISKELLVLLKFCCTDNFISQAPASMKSVLQAVNLLTVAFGNLIVIIVAEAKALDQVSQESSG